MPRLLDSERHNAVERDGLPRVADYDDGVQRVLYLDGVVVRSMDAADYLAQRGPLPTEPTEAEVAAALAAREQTRQEAARDALALRQALRTKLASAVGVQIDDLLVGQLRALMAYLLWEKGLLNRDMTIRLPDRLD